MARVGDVEVGRGNLVAADLDAHDGVRAVLEVRAGDRHARAGIGSETGGRRELRYGRARDRRRLAAEGERETGSAARSGQLRRSETRSHVVAARGLEQVRVAVRI